MIGCVDVAIQAQSPNMPLFPMRAFVNSPSSVRLRNVPKKIGKWNLTNVYFVAAYPDGSIKTASCELVGGVWVGTVEGSTLPGTSENGYSVVADGIDEHGNPVVGYVLGKGLIEILDAEGSIKPGETISYVHLLSAEPSAPKDGDLYPTDDDQYVIWQDGEAHSLGGMTSAEVSAFVTHRDIQDWWTFEGGLPDVEYSITSVTEAGQITWYLWQDNRIISQYGPNTDFNPEQIEFWDDEHQILIYANHHHTDLNALGLVTYGDLSISLSVSLSSKQDVLTQAQMVAVNSGIDSTKVQTYDNYQSDISYAVDVAENAQGTAMTAADDAIRIMNRIPDQTWDEGNELADKAFVNSSVQTATANFRGNWATWALVPSTSADYPVDYAGSKVPTVNDYLVVVDASDLSSSYEGTWRFKYSGTWSTDGKSGWLPEYQVNETPMTAAQLAALNSGITSAKVAYYDDTLSGLETLINSI